MGVIIWVISLSICGSAYELQETIHALNEENVHLHHRLENLTNALSNLKHLLLDHSRNSEAEHPSRALHAWNEWTQNSINAETQLILEQAFCWPELHGVAKSLFSTPVFCLLLSPFSTVLY